MHIFFGKILFLPVMTKKNGKIKKHCSPTRSKTILFQHFVEKKNVKNRSSSHASLPVAKPYFFDILLKKGRKKP